MDDHDGVPGKTGSRVDWRRRDSRFLAAVDYLVGYDVFISYGWQDGSNYSAALKERLENAGMACFWDKEQVSPGSPLKPTLGRALRRSAALVVVGTPAAFGSRYVADEVTEFAKRNRPLIPILPPGAGQQIPWEVVKALELVWIEEASDLIDGKPSDRTVRDIERALKGTRKRTLATRLMLGASAAILAFAVAAFAISLRYIKKAAQASSAAAAAHDQELKAQAATRKVIDREQAATIESLARQASSGNEPIDYALLLGIEAVKRATASQPRLRGLAQHALLRGLARTGGIPLMTSSDDMTIQGAYVTERGRWLALSIYENKGRSTLVFDLNGPYRGAVWRHTSSYPEGNPSFSLEGLEVSPDGRFVIEQGQAGDTSDLWCVACAAPKPARIDGRPNATHVLEPLQRIFTPDSGWFVLANALYRAMGNGSRLVAKSKHKNAAFILSPDGEWLAEFIERGPRSAFVLRRVSELEKNRPAALMVRGAPEIQDPRDTPIEEEEIGAEVQQSVPFAVDSERFQFSNDSRWILVFSANQAFLFDLRSDKFQRFVAQKPSEGPELKIHAFSPDSQLLMIGEAGNLKLYNLGVQRPRELKYEGLARIEPAGTNSYYPTIAVGFSQDGRWVAVGGVDTYLWDRTSERGTAQPVVLRGSPDDPVQSIAFSPDGRWVVSGGRLARLWDLSVADPNTTRVNITTLTSDANKFAFSPDSHWLISLGHGIDRWFPEPPYTYHVWPVAVEDELRVAAQLAGRSLSSSEWNFLFPNEQNPNAPK